MSSKYIVRQPIKDPDGRIIGHEILYHGESQAFGNMDKDSVSDFASANTIYNFLTQNSTKVLKDTLNFMTFTPSLLMRKTPRLFEKSDLVIQIDDTVMVHPLSMRFVKQYSKEGYKIAINEFQFIPRYLALMDHISYVKIKAESTAASSMRNIIEVAHSMHKKCIVTDIQDAEQYRLALTLKADALEGSYIAENLMVPVHNSSYLQSNFFRLMVAISRDEPDINEIQQLIAMDAGLSYGLLKLVNSAYFALRHQATTIQQAIMILGLAQLKQWIYLLSISDTEIEDEKQERKNQDMEEFSKLSFMRANFCSELMKYAQDMPITQSEAYLMGMFSTLNYMIDAPLDEILSEIPIKDEIRTALLNREGRCGKLYELVLSYESANWNAITELSDELGIPNHLLTNLYFTCMENVNLLWEQLTNSYLDQTNPANKTDKNTSANF